MLPISTSLTLTSLTSEPTQQYWQSLIGFLRGRLLEKSFDLVHIDIGQGDKNVDVGKQYDIPLERGIPAIAVLDFDGKLLFSQKRGEFEAARSMSTEDILDFLNKWKPVSPAH